MMRSLLDPPPDGSRARFRDRIPRFLLTVDTEEEFDWEKPLSRESQGTEHVGRLAKFQEFCERQGVKPIYLIDWPIANSERAAEILAVPLREGLAEVGVQLHPWVNPPFDEEVSQHNSFAGNLPPHLEEAKFVQLRDTIEQNFGVSPVIYRAGRYGAGAHTAKMLHDQGIAIDTSVRPQFDYSSVNGPDYRGFPINPYWLDDDRTLLELPLTSAYWGLLRKQGEFIYPKLWRAPVLRGILSRMQLLERVPLTPEGVSVEEAIRAIDIALDDGAPMLVFSFHSPSLRPGNTPYVRTEEDLDGLYDWWRRIFAYLKQRGIKPSSVQDIMMSVER